MQRKELTMKFASVASSDSDAAEYPNYTKRGGTELRERDDGEERLEKVELPFDDLFPDFFGRPRRPEINEKDYGIKWCWEMIVQAG